MLHQEPTSVLKGTEPLLRFLLGTYNQEPKVTRTDSPVLQISDLNFFLLVLYNNDKIEQVEVAKFLAFVIDENFKLGQTYWPSSG